MGDNEQEILLEELREEVNYLHEQVQRKSDRASRIIRFNSLAITLVIGLIRFGNEGRFELRQDFVLGGIILVGSILSALYCLVVASQGSHPSRLTPQIPPKGDNEFDDSESAREQLIENRITNLSKRVRDYELRSHILSDFLTFAVVSGPFGAAILFAVTLESVEGIERGPLEAAPTLTTSFVVAFLLGYLSLRTVKWTRTGTVPGNRYSPRSDQ